MRWIATLLLVLGTLCAAPAQAQTLVRFKTVLGDFDVELLDAGAPQTVANFLAYLAGPDYDASFIHRSVPSFVIQGGGFAFADGSFALVPTDPPVVNEFGRSNLRATIAMAKLSGDPDSATSQWFVNLVDNSVPLDTDNGGFTVFGDVIGSGMTVVDAIAAIPTFNATIIHPALAELPLRDFTAGDLLDPPNQLILITRIGVLLPGPVSCGDVDDDGSPSVSDRDLLRQHLADPGGALIPAAGRSKCDVRESFDTCDVLDYVALARSLDGHPEDVQQVCFAAVEAPAAP